MLYSQSSYNPALLLGPSSQVCSLMQVKDCWRLLHHPTEWNARLRGTHLPDIYIPPEPQPAKLVSSWRFASKCKTHSNVKSQLGKFEKWQSLIPGAAWKCISCTRRNFEIFGHSWRQKVKSWAESLCFYRAPSFVGFHELWSILFRVYFSSLDVV